MRAAKYLQQLILFSLFLGLIPVIALGLYAYHRSSEAVLDQVIQGNIHTLGQKKTMVENVLEQVDYSVIQMISQPSFKDMMNQRLDENDFVIYREISARLTSLVLSRFSDNHYLLVNLAYDWMINPDGLSAFSTYGKREQVIGYTALPDSSTWITTESLPSRRRTQAASTTYVSLIKKLPMLTHSTQPKGLLIMEINMMEVNRLLTDDYKSGDFILLDSQYNPLIDAQELLARDPGQSRQLIETLKGLPEDSNYLEMELGEQAGVIIERSSYNGWIYLSVVSIKEMTEGVRSIGWITTLFSLGIFGVTLIIGFWGTLIMYKPVRRLYRSAATGNAAPDRKLDRDEFKVIEKRIHHLVQTENRLNEQWKVHLPQLREQFAMKLLRDQIHFRELEAKLDSLHYHWRDWHSFVVMALEIDSLERTPHQEKDRDLLLFAVQNIVSELIPAEQRLTPVIIDQTLLAILKCKPVSKAMKQEANKSADSVKAAVRHYLKLSVSIGFSRSYAELTDTYKAYGEAMEALSYRIRLGTGVVLHLDEVTVAPGEPTVSYPKELERDLLQAIRLGDQPWVLSSLRDLLQSTLTHAVSHRQFELLIGRLIVHLIEEIHTDDRMMRKLTGEKSIFEDLGKIHSLEEAESLLMERVIAPLLAFREQARSDRQDDIAESVIQLIRQKFDTDLTLDFCASQLNFHPTYISRVFKKETGLSFSEYLAQYRLNVSKQWLKDTDLQIQQIAERLKYNSAAAFIRYFRKIEGITPNQYREKAKR